MLHGDLPGFRGWPLDHVSRAEWQFVRGVAVVLVQVEAARKVLDHDGRDLVGDPERFLCSLVAGHLGTEGILLDGRRRIVGGLRGDGDQASGSRPRTFKAG